MCVLSCLALYKIVRPSEADKIANLAQHPKSMGTAALYELDRQSQPSRRGCHCWICRWFGIACIPRKKNVSKMYLIGF